MNTRVFLTIATIIIFSPFIVGAQLTGPNENSVELNVSPQNPGPNQTVKASLVSYSIDINRADITWSVNGTAVSSGKGLKTFSFTTGNLGTKTDLEILIISDDGYPISKNLTFAPASVDLLFEAESYTPPFYRGKAYFPYQGRARVIAIPSFVDEAGKQIPSSNLVFSWKNGSNNLASASGVGRNILEYKGSIPIRTGAISVAVSSLDSKYVAEKRLNVEPTESKIVLYENSPEYGVLYNKALGDSISLNKEEITVFAVPYYFNASKSDDYDLKYEWSLNGSQINTSSNLVVLKKPAGGGGQANLSLQLSNTTDIFQFANTSLAINFGSVVKNLFPSF